MFGLRQFFAAGLTLVTLTIGSVGVAGGAAASADATVTGTVLYLERIALPPNAIITVRLVDVSRADAPAIVIAEQQITLGDRQVPVPFVLTYDTARIDPRFSYAVQARIEVDGTLLFINTERYAVITQGNPTQREIIVRRVAEPGGSTTPGLPATGGGGGGGGATTGGVFGLLATLILGLFLARSVAARKGRIGGQPS